MSLDEAVLATSWSPWRMKRLRMLAFLVMDRVPSTLKRHPSGCRRWLVFCSSSGIVAGCPGCNALADFLEALFGRGRILRSWQRAFRLRQGGGARSVFHCPQAGMQTFQLYHVVPWLQWLSAQKRVRRAPTQALPLPLFTICELELAMVSCDEPEDRFGCFSLML